VLVSTWKSEKSWASPETKKSTINRLEEGLLISVAMASRLDYLTILDQLEG
jgi:hypothetical protein